MLLRLLPLPTPSNPSPLTILFTLPLPTHAYTSRSLPLPPALLSHRGLCLQEDIQCQNVLLGEKSSWICGIVDDVTFSLPTATIAVNLIDGTSITMPITPSCVAQLHRVIEEVHLSFTAPAQAPAPPRTSTSSIASNASTSSTKSVPPSPTTSRRSPSALLLSLLSPLLSSSTPSVVSRSSLAAPPCAPARVHRRQARSILVDTYRRYVLPVLKEQLPSAFLPWAIKSETTRQLEEYAKLKEEINQLLESSGVDRNASYSRSRSSSASSTVSLSDDESDMESTPSPITPATSVFSNTSGCPTPARSRSAQSPQSFLLSIPPAHCLPVHARATYSGYLARLTQIASRVSQIRKLGIRYEREEGKRHWLEGLERGRAADKSLRRAFSNGYLPANGLLNAEPSKSSKLWRSWTADDLMRAELAAEQSQAVHPAMMDCSSDEGSSEEEEEGPITPPKSRVGPTDRPDLSSIVGTVTPVQITDEEFTSIIRVKARRPSLERCAAILPALVASRSAESLADTESDEEWDHDSELQKISSTLAATTLLAAPVIASKWPIKDNGMKKKIGNVKSASLVIERDAEEEDRYYGQCRIYA
ncbi:hypothetical protein CI109_105151 [Kwoniella shandongensis]|uniref:Uncharacterized protein n=1 Tax=Kwoniella shandongensis TaxID=1734106 RepID=A0A5M6C7Z2_9TREE|nr:uncharacterized protein CI109_001990 [Kwoniella shandongensis]KAA5529565.1 hypothetical protein CI109_001990 [Kwoniella shandongensis]